MRRYPDNPEWRAQYQQSDRGREVGAKAKVRYRSSPEGQAREREYRLSNKGQAIRRAEQAKRRSGPMAKRLTREIAAGLHRCYWCDGLAEVADHVLPLAMARAFGIATAEADLYVAPMCSRCHRIKTRQDVSDMHRIRRALASGGALAEMAYGGGLLTR